MVLFLPIDACLPRMVGSLMFGLGLVCVVWVVWVRRVLLSSM